MTIEKPGLDVGSEIIVCLKHGEYLFVHVVHITHVYPITVDQVLIHT